MGNFAMGDDYLEIVRNSTGLLHNPQVPQEPLFFWQYHFVLFLRFLKYSSESVVVGTTLYHPQPTGFNLMM
jgi:hypothetical protein